jgi:hypothetical protein
MHITYIRYVMCSWSRRIQYCTCLYVQPPYLCYLRLLPTCLPRRFVCSVCISVCADCLASYMHVHVLPAVVSCLLPLSYMDVCPAYLCVSPPCLSCLAVFPNRLLVLPACVYRQLLPSALMYRWPFCHIWHSCPCILPPVNLACLFYGKIIGYKSCVTFSSFNCSVFCAYVTACLFKYFSF